MNKQANRNYVSNDDINTPEYLCEKIIKHFIPTGKILEPCKGSGNFLKFLPENTYWCEIKENRDFFDFLQKINWIITNPPWSQMRKFLQHSLSLSKNVVFLMTINHLWTKARLRDIKEADFGIMVDTPTTFPPLGFQVGVIHLQKYYSGDIYLTDWTTTKY